MPEHPGIPQLPAEIRESISKQVWIKLAGPAAGPLTEAFCQRVAGLQKNMSVKVVTPREEDAAQKDDENVKPITVPPAMIVMEGKAPGAQKYIKVEQLYRVVLLGNTEAGKNSLANTIFGEELFKVDNTECQTESKSLHGRRITLVNTPDLLCTNRSEEELKPEILRCVTECTPGPHAFLIVLNVEKSTDQQQQAVIEKISQYFSEELFKYATVVFTQDSPDSDEMKIKQFIDQNKYLSDLMRKCKSRYHIINKCNLKGDNLSNQSQVTELLNKIDQTVKQNKGVCYTSRKLQCGDTCSNISVSKNDMIKLTGPAAESVAKAFSGPTVVVLTPGSDVEEEVEKEDAKEEAKKEEEIEEEDKEGEEEIEEEIEEAKEEEEIEEEEIEAVEEDKETETEAVEREDKEEEEEEKENEDHTKEEEILDGKKTKHHSKERGQSTGGSGFGSTVDAIFRFCLGLGNTLTGCIAAALGFILATVIKGLTAISGTRAMLKVSKVVEWVIEKIKKIMKWAIEKMKNLIKLIKWVYNICRLLARIKKMYPPLQDLCQNQGVIVLVFVFYSLLLSWLFLKGPFAGTLILTQFLFLVIILAIIEF
uniref:AIG1-type G domain-containing protein n=2 Tax=Astatotilapia calliptera TaxID=8154 RepID=A0A3P8NDS8_ASTCA